MFRRRRPLLRAAAVGGAAYHMGKKVQEGRDGEAAADEYADGDPGNEGPASITDEGIEQLKKLSELKAQGVLTEEEFEEQKRRILGT
jgi:hypothetical protein